MKQYKSNKELLEYLISKNIIINNKKETLKKIERYSYYSIVNTYKEVFKDTNNSYKNNVTFEEIFALYEFDKNLKAIFIKYALEIEVIIKSLMANTIAKNYGIENYLNKSCFDSNANIKDIKKLLEQIDKKIKSISIKNILNIMGFPNEYI